MSRNYFSASDFGRAISAEELTAMAECGCGQTTPETEPETDPCGCAAATPAAPAQTGCGCSDAPTTQPDSVPVQPAQTVCCCQTVARPQPAAPVVNEGCCCKESFRAALRVLCDTEIAETLDFTQTAFLTDAFVAGTTLAAPAAGGDEAPAADTAAPADNLADTLTGTFRRFSPCSCDLLDINAVPAYPVPDGAALPFTAEQVSTCALSAVVIQAAEGTAEGELSAEEVAARDFRRIKRALSARLNPAGTCGQTAPMCACGEECCCVSGVLSALSGSNLSRRVTLTAGYLALNNVELLGTAGNVLVLASDDPRRVYFVCAAKVQFLG